MKRILTVVGARPQVIKMAPISRAFEEAGCVDEITVHTGQHFDTNMSDVFFERLEIAKPDYHLGVNGGGHSAMTGAMLLKLGPLLQEIQPECVLVYGDTNSTLAGALAASKLHIPIAHIEAGLRSFNRRMPEEQNRVLTDHLSDWLFSPTDTATQNLIREGIDETRIDQVGDVMYDVALMFGEKAQEESRMLNKLSLERSCYVLATVHRAGNTDNGRRLCAILEGLEAVAEELPLVLPCHPRTRDAMNREGFVPRNIRLTEPVGYLDMMALEKGAAAIVTDSGGVQKEAYFHGVPCVTLREETEWVELIEMGWNRLAPPENGKMAEKILCAIGQEGEPGTPYGDGNAADRIVESLA